MAPKNEKLCQNKKLLPLNLQKKNTYIFQKKNVGNPLVVYIYIYIILTTNGRQGIKSYIWSS